MLRRILLLKTIFQFAYAHGSMFAIVVLIEVGLRILQAGSFFVSIKSIIFVLDPESVYSFISTYFSNDIRDKYPPLQINLALSFFVLLYFSLFPVLRYVSSVFVKISVNRHLEKQCQDELENIPAGVFSGKYLSCIKSAKDFLASLLFFTLSSFVVYFLSPTLLGWICTIGILVALISAVIEKSAGRSFRFLVTSISYKLNNFFYGSGLNYWSKHLKNALPFDLVSNLNLTVFGFGLSLFLLLPLIGFVPPTSSILTSFYVAVLVRFQYSAFRDVGVSSGRFFKSFSSVPRALRS